MRRVEQRGHELQPVAEALPIVKIEAGGQAARIVDAQADAVFICPGVYPDHVLGRGAGRAMFGGVGQQFIDNDRQRNDFTGWNGGVVDAGGRDPFNRRVLGVKSIDALHEGVKEFGKGYRRLALAAVEVMDCGDGTDLPDRFGEYRGLLSGAAGVAMQQGGESLQAVFDAVVSFPQQGFPAGSSQKTEFKVR